MRIFFPAVLCLAAFTACSTAGKADLDGTQPNIYTIVAEKARVHYGAWITDSDKSNSLFIGVIPNERNFFSYEYVSPYKYVEYKGSNAAIFPRFK
jgi:hypothetical protein